MDLEQYDKFILFFSGGKDCTACYFWLREMGVPNDKIELWHHEIDGREGEQLMDWPITVGYCRAFAAHFNVSIYFSWKVGGFEGEMLRHNSKTAATAFENEKGEVIVRGGKGGKESTRLRFPQVSANLSVRWCSAYLKIDVAILAIRNQARFKGLKVCTVSGERGEESTARGKYAIHEKDKANFPGVREVDRIRPIRDKAESWIWAIIERWGCRVHPAYYLGWGRVSCATCIFMDANQAATARVVLPKQFERVCKYEEIFGVTIKRNKSLRQLAADGIIYSSLTEELIEIARGTIYPLSIFIENWRLPAGAYKKGGGPI